MKFLMLMIPAAYQGPDRPKADENFAPPADAVERMMKYNEELAKAGALIQLDGLHPLSKGARVSFVDGTPNFTDGPYIEAKEVVGGYWIIQAPSKEAAVEWAMKVPAADGDVIEVRPIFGEEDWPEDVRKAADNETVRAAVRR